MADRLKGHLERGLRIFKFHSAEVSSTGHREQTVLKEGALESESPSPAAGGVTEVPKQTTNAENGSDKRAFTWRKRRPLLNTVNSLSAIKLKMLFFTAMYLLCLSGQHVVQAGFFTFYFPNIFKPKGFGEVTDMIEVVQGMLNETRDSFADSQYFWGQMQKFDSVQADYPEESACSEVFPQFRDLSISYVYADFDHYIKPFELYEEHLLKMRAQWYPAGLESKAALPRLYEQQLYEKELELKIEWMDKLVNNDHFKDQRERLREIWRSVRRGLDTSVACIYLRFAYQQISEDINETALQANLESMKEAMVLLRNAYKRIEVYKESDKKIIHDIGEELLKIERFTIR